MELEQIKPNKPNFGLVVAIATVLLLAIFVFALLFLHVDARHLFSHGHAHPTSALQTAQRVWLA